MKIRYLFLLLFITPTLFAQDTIKTDNKWFTEFQIANSTGITLDLINGSDLAIGRRIFKNIDLRILGGFNSDEEDGNGMGEVTTDIYKYTNTRYSAGFDILYRIRIVRDLLFKTGLGYEYYYDRSNSTRNYTYAGNGESGFGTDQSERKKYSNNFRASGSFSYSFTNNIYLFVQVYLTYGISHGTNNASSYSNYSGTENTYLYSSDYKNDNFKADNLILGGGISF